jgi:hypothetical protein
VARHTFAPMNRTTAVGLPVVAVLALLGGCGQAEAPSPSAPPPPTSVQDADPCSFVARSVVTENDLERASNAKSETSRSCSWTSASFSMMVLVRWDSDSLIDFSQAFPVLVGNEDIGGLTAVVGKSDVRPACAAVFFVDQGTILEVVVGDEPPSTADSACGRVRTIGAGAVRKIRDQGLLTSAAAPTT